MMFIGYWLYIQTGNHVTKYSDWVLAADQADSADSAADQADLAAT